VQPSRWRAGAASALPVAARVKKVPVKTAIRHRCRGGPAFLESNGLASALLLPASPARSRR